MSMSPDVILGAIILLPIVILMVLRINAALVFLSLCLGSVLVQFVAPETKGFIEDFSFKANTDLSSTSNNTIKLVLLLFPTILTSIFMIRTVSGRGKLFLNLLPAIGVGLLGALLIVPLLPPGVSHDIVRSNLWDQVVKAQVLIVGSSALVCMLVLWMQRPKTGGNKHDKKKH